MTDLQFSSHAEKRMRQRGVRYEDVAQVVSNTEEPKLLGGGLLSYALCRRQSDKTGKLHRLVVVIDPVNTVVVTILKIDEGKRNSYVGNYRRCA